MPERPRPDLESEGATGSGVSRSVTLDSYWFDGKIDRGGDAGIRMSPCLSPRKCRVTAYRTRRASGSDLSVSDVLGSITDRLGLH
jgi:hypothetical protein